VLVRRNPTGSRIGLSFADDHMADLNPVCSALDTEDNIGRAMVTTVQPRTCTRGAEFTDAGHKDAGQ
jgi:hypothetical protein